MVSPVVAATLPTDRRARREAPSVDSITRRPPVIWSAIGRNGMGNGAELRRTVCDNSVMNCSARRSAGRRCAAAASVASTAGGPTAGDSIAPMACRASPGCRRMIAWSAPTPAGSIECPIVRRGVLARCVGESERMDGAARRAGAVRPTGCAPAGSSIARRSIARRMVAGRMDPGWRVGGWLVAGWLVAGWPIAGWPVVGWPIVPWLVHARPADRRWVARRIPTGRPAPVRATPRSANVGWLIAGRTTPWRSTVRRAGTLRSDVS